MRFACSRTGLSDRALAWLFVGPTIVLLLAFNIFPLLWTIYLSFTNFRANRRTPTAVGRHQQLPARAERRSDLGETSRAPRTSWSRRSRCSCCSASASRCC
jgi:ABC-type sugar transport system permease subunit